MKAAILAIVIGAAGVSGAADPGGQGRRSALEVISRQATGFRLATSADFVASLADKNRGEIVIEADFDRDGHTDSAVLLINDELKESRIYLLLGGHDDARLLFSRKWTAVSGEHPIRTPMFLKPAGERGPVQRMYSPLRGRDADDYAAVPAIEVWTGQQHDERDSGLEDWAYCSRTWFFLRGQLRNFQVCD